MWGILRQIAAALTYLLRPLEAAHSVWEVGLVLAAIGALTVPIAVLSGLASGYALAGAIGVLAVWAVMRLRRGEPEILAGDVSSNPFTLTQPVLLPNGAVVNQPTSQPTFWYVGFFNGHHRTTATRVSARCELRRPTGERLFRTGVAAWGANGRPYLGTDVILPDQDLPPTEAPADLVLCLRHASEDEVYLVDRQTGNRQTAQWRDERYRVPPGRYELLIHLSGENTSPVTFAYDFENPGSTGALVVRSKGRTGRD